MVPNLWKISCNKYDIHTNGVLVAHHDLHAHIQCTCTSTCSNDTKWYQELMSWRRSVQLRCTPGCHRNTNSNRQQFPYFKSARLLEINVTQWTACAYGMHAYPMAYTCTYSILLLFREVYWSMAVARVTTSGEASNLRMLYAFLQSPLTFQMTFQVELL